MNKNQNKNPTQVIKDADDGVKTFIGTADQFDDITMLAIRLLK